MLAAERAAGLGGGGRGAKSAAPRIWWDRRSWPCRQPRQPWRPRRQPRRPRRRRETRAGCRIWPSRS